MEYDGELNGELNGDDRVNDSLSDSLNDSVNSTYQAIKANPGIQRKRISELTGKSIPTIDRHIALLAMVTEGQVPRHLAKSNLIEHRDSDKTGVTEGQVPRHLVMTDTAMIERLKQFVEGEIRSCSMDIGGITPLYVYRMWGGSVLDYCHRVWTYGITEYFL